MLSKDKLVTLNKYLVDLNNRLSSPTPDKHKNYPHEYVQFLKHEIEMVTRKIENDKLERTNK